MKSCSKPYIFERNSKGGGRILCAMEDILSKLINSSFTDDVKEYSFVELNLRKHKLLIICNYNPHKTITKGYLEYISKETDSHLLKCDSFFNTVF